MAELSARLGERLMRDSREVAAYIAARWGVLHRVRGAAARLGFEYKRPESLPARADEAKQAAFISRYDQLLNGLGRRRGRLLRRCRAPGVPVPPRAWLGPQGRQGGVADIGAPAPQPPRGAQPGEFPLPSLDAASTIALLAKLEASNPGKRRIYVIVDNARDHHARVVRQWLERPDCRITPVFLPAYAPHLNAIERLWAVMHREVTHNRFYLATGSINFGHFVDAVFDFFRRRLHKSGQNGEIPFHR